MLLFDISPAEARQGTRVKEISIIIKKLKGAHTKTSKWELIFVNETYLSIEHISLVKRGKLESLRFRGVVQNASG